MAALNQSLSVNP